MGLGPDLGASAHAPLSRSSRPSQEASQAEKNLVRLTLRPLRSEERVHLTVEAGCKIRDVRHLIEQKFGVASPAKILRFSKRTYAACEDHERITRDRVLHLKDVEWLQDPNAPSKSIVAQNPDAFVDRPRPRKDAENETNGEREGPIGQAPQQDEAWRDLHKFKDKFGHYRVVHTHVWVRVAPSVEARRLGLLQQDRVVSGHILDNWLLLDGPSRAAATGEEVKSGPAWALIDGREMGYGVLLERQEAGHADSATVAARSGKLRSELAKENKAANARAPSGQPASAALAAELQVANNAAGFGAAAWLVLPPEEAAADEALEVEASSHSAAEEGALELSASRHSAAGDEALEVVASSPLAAADEAPEKEALEFAANSPSAAENEEALGALASSSLATEDQAVDVAAGSHSAAESRVAHTDGLELPVEASAASAARVATSALAGGAPTPAATAPAPATAFAQTAAVSAPAPLAATSMSSAASVPTAGASAPAAATSASAAAALAPEQQDLDVVFSQLSSRLSLMKEDSHEVLRDLLRSADTRKQAKEVLEILYTFERLRELRATAPSTPEVAASAPPAAAVAVRAPEVTPEGTLHLSVVPTDDPLRLRQVFTAGWRYGEWHQDSERFRQRTPFGMLRGALQPELLAYLLDRAPFNAVSEDAHMALRGKYRMGREKFEGKADFVKADWHTVPGLPEVASVFIPRHGARGPALRAPDHVTAFAAAFRAVNVSVWEALAARLRSGLAPRGREELEGLGGFFADALDQGRQFGVAELQHFWGEGFDGKMHVDGTTSTLHLAVSLSGKRWLHVRSALNKAAPECQQDVYEMLPGDVYLSSPATFQHQVCYPTCDFKNAMASLHMRFLFEPHWWLKKWVNHTRDMDMREVHSAVADVLHNHRIRLPTLAEVKEHEARVSRQAPLRDQAHRSGVGPTVSGTASVTPTGTLRAPPLRWC